MLAVIVSSDPGIHECASVTVTCPPASAIITAEYPNADPISGTACPSAKPASSAGLPDGHRGRDKRSRPARRPARAYACQHLLVLVLVVWVFGALDQVHPERHDCRRLPEIEHLRRPAQNHPGSRRSAW